VKRALDRHGDLLLALVSAALFAVQVGGDPGALATGVAFSATLAVRRRRPLIPLAAGVALIELSNLAFPALGNTGTFFVGFVCAIYAAGRHTRRHATALAAGLVAVALPLATIEPGEPFSASDAAFIAVALAGPFLAGLTLRRRHERSAAEASQAVADERVRIARELHDVVAHAISVMVLQARGGRRKLPPGADETRTALDEIERAGEQALAEMRRLLALLRDEDEEPDLAPQPSLSRLDELVAGLRASGLPVALTVEGAPRGLPPGVEVTAFRIVQEALTNALKHAGPARAQVILRYSPSQLELEVLDDGGGTGDGAGTGHGLAGMRERVAIYGGELHSGRRPEGGYALRARLPLTP
jgi:signal transduction histidine kinase